MTTAARPTPSGGASGADDINAVVEQLGGPVEFGTPAKGGTYRIANTDFANTDGFDPTGEYFGSAWAIYTDLLLRHAAQLQPRRGQRRQRARAGPGDRHPGRSTDDGLTYTFTLKDGIKFGPPVNRAVTSKDIAYAFQRHRPPPASPPSTRSTTRPSRASTSSLAGKAKTISGITTPDDKTIVFTLTEPTGDFLFRLAMPATAPIPEEVAKCHTAAGEYGRYVISTGPYMIEGSDKLDISSCAAQKPISGFDPNTGLNAGAQPELRPGHRRRPRLARDAAGPVRDRRSTPTSTTSSPRSSAVSSRARSRRPPNAVLRSTSQHPDIRERLRVNSGDRDLVRLHEPDAPRPSTTSTCARR